ncbi:hypothetical protein NQ318_022425, partial [Aromia moschata]
NALDCYQCDKDTCAKEVDTWKTQTCGKQVDPYLPACVTHTYKDATDKKEYSVRKCVSYTKTEAYKCKADLGEEVACVTCTTDLCNKKNSANGISLSFVAVVGALLASLLPKYLQ